MPTKVGKNKETRTAGRLSVSLHGEVHTRDGAQPVRIRDVSASGAQVSTSEALDVDSDVLFARADTLAAAKVMWTKDAQAGLKFYRPLDVEDITGKNKD